MHQKKPPFSIAVAMIQLSATETRFVAFTVDGPMQDWMRAVLTLSRGKFPAVFGIPQQALFPVPPQAIVYLHQGHEGVENLPREGAGSQNPFHVFGPLFVIPEGQQRGCVEQVTSCFLLSPFILGAPLADSLLKKILSGIDTPSLATESGDRVLGNGNQPDRVLFNVPLSSFVSVSMRNFFRISAGIET